MTGRLVAALLVLALAGCAVAPPHHGGHPEREARRVDHRGLDDALAFLRDDAFQRAGREGMAPLASALARLDTRRPVLAAEHHDRYEDHLYQLAVLDALHRGGRAVAVGVEWFQRDVQTHLDDYIAGRIDERTLLRQSRYFERWGFDYRLYRPLMRYARRHGIPVIALNAPPEQVRRVSDQGFAALPEAVRSRAGNGPDALPDAYVERLRRVFERHPDTSDFAHFVAVQLLWDETMAAAAAEHLDRHPDLQLLILAGRGHVLPRHTIPDRLAAYSGREPAIAATVEAGAGSSADGIDFPLSPPALALPEPGRLGIRMTEDNDGVVIESLQDGGAAKAAEIPVGARLLRIAGRAVATTADVRLALYDRRSGDTVTVTYRAPETSASGTRRITLK